MDFKEVKPITLLITSGGGNVEAGGQIISIIRSIRSPVDGLVIGHAGSMAVDVLLSCRERRAFPEARIFMHFTRCGFEVICDSDEITEHDVAALKKKMTSERDRAKNLYAKRLKKSEAEINRLFWLGEKYNLDYNAEEALTLGVIDRIDYDFKFFEPAPVAGA
jgi:ATP-dependent protease ClpP protease subunit